MKNLEDVAPDDRILRNAFACVPSGVAAVCALADGKPAGLAASSFTSVSLAPPLVSVCIRKESATWPKLASADRVGISMLSADHGRICAALSSKAVDRFGNVSWFSSDRGAVFIEGATAYFDCSVFQAVQAGDHDIILLRIEALAASPNIEPLVFHGSRFRRLETTLGGSAA